MNFEKYVHKIYICQYAYLSGSCNIPGLIDSCLDPLVLLQTMYELFIEILSSNESVGGQDEAPALGEEETEPGLPSVPCWTTR